MATSDRIISGIQPSGDLHLGNYFGALADQRDRSGADAFFFVADLHALAAGRDPALIADSTRRVASTALAIGVGRDGGHLFRQSDVGEILQLQWLLGSVIEVEELAVDVDLRARRERGAPVTASRADYALLMAADILSIRATEVVVGADQEQHIRMVRAYAAALNRRCAEPVVPESIRRVPARPRPVVLGRGGVKMSKSVGNGLSLRATRAEVAAYVASLHADELPDRAGDCVLLNLHRHAGTAEVEGWAADYERWRENTRAIAEARDALVEAIDATLDEWRESFAYYDSPDGEAAIADRFEEGAEAARALASETVRAVREALRTPHNVGRGRPVPRPDDGAQALSYSAYINMPAVFGLIAPPAAPPIGVPEAQWPWAEFEGSPGADPNRVPDRAPWALPPFPTHHPAWAHDEVLFISTHQAFEVWFRHALFELDDIVERAEKTFAAHGVTATHGSVIPHSVRMDRHPEQVARMHFAHTLRAHERLSALVDTIEADAVETPELAEYADWIRESPRPGAFPDDVDVPEFRLAWFADQFPLWTERVERTALILRTATTFYDVLRRMPPKSFLEFRGRLDPASGFGSAQFRELEILSGQRERHFEHFGMVDGRGEVVDEALFALLEKHAGNRSDALDVASRANAILERALPPDQFERVRARMHAATLRDLADLFLLAGTGDGDARHALADRVAAGNLGELYATGKRRRRHGFAHTQREREMWRMVGDQLSHMESIAATAVLGDDPAFAAGDLDDAGRREFKRFLEGCLELDRALMAWRLEHLSFVEAMIGARPGTGGGGLVYLQATMQASRADYVLRSFPPVWAARSLLVDG